MGWQLCNSPTMSPCSTTVPEERFPSVVIHMTNPTYRALRVWFKLVSVTSLQVFTFVYCFPLCFSYHKIISIHFCSGLVVMNDDNFAPYTLECLSFFILGVRIWGCLIFGSPLYIVWNWWYVRSRNTKQKGQQKAQGIYIHISFRHVRIIIIIWMIKHWYLLENVPRTTSQNRCTQHC